MSTRYESAGLAHSDVPSWFVPNQYRTPRASSELPGIDKIVRRKVNAVFV